MRSCRLTSHVNFMEIPVQCVNKSVNSNLDRLGLVVFYGMSTLLGYLMPIPVYTYIYTYT